MALFTTDTHFAMYMNAKDPKPSQDLHSRDALAPVFADPNRYDATTHFVGQSTICALAAVSNEHFPMEMASLVGIGIGVILPNLSFAQSQTIPSQGGQPNQVSITYVPPQNPAFQDLYDLLRDRRALENIQEVLGPLLAPEQLAIKTTECGAVNSYYQREYFKPTVTICYEFLKRILESLPNQATPEGLTPADAAVGQFFWVTLHEIGHAAFDMFEVPIFGHEEDAADNFATYIMLQFGRGQARRLIGGAAWAWRAYLGDYQKNPVVPTRLAVFASDHGLPQERFYNIVCLALGANRQEFADLESFLPSTRSPRCLLEYQTLVRAFHKEISPHIDQEMAKRVLDTDWLGSLEWEPIPQK